MDENTGRKEKHLPELRPEDLPLQEIERRVLMFPQLTEAAVKVTKSTDWVDYGGKPWLRTPGAERVKRAFGLTVKDTRYEKIERHDQEGSYYMYLWTGKIGLAKLDIWEDAIGGCSSRDPFHYLDHGKKKHLEEIDELNVMKDGFSNMTENGVTRFFGLRGMEWEELEKMGIKREKGEKVVFKKKGEEKPGKTGAAGEPPDPRQGAQKEADIRHRPPPERPETGKEVNPKTRESLIDYAINKVLGTREQISQEIKETLTVKQCNYILTNLAKLQGDVKLDTLKDIVRGATYSGGGT